MKYRVNEIFFSLQGEGFNQGKEVIFIRLAGCNLSCVWCDTNYHPYTEYTVEEIMEEIAKYPCQSILLTGGEPSAQPLNELLNALKAKAYWIAIETNGTISLERYNGQIDYITVSPKKHINQFYADELRVVNDKLNVDYLSSLETKIQATDHFISPLEENGIMNIEDSMRLVAQMNKHSNNRWRLSLQLHKLIGMR
ncbi:MAG: radical SAM protein [Bacteroidetes bacterium]|jgi:organic radical activating enzyme|nr:radical SAM protein [Bacteroidota bacterium]